MGKLVQCKTCGEEIAKDAKICPKCGAKQKNHKVLPVIIGVIALLVIVGAMGGNNEKDQPDVASPQQSQTQDVTKAQEQDAEPEQEQEAEPEEIVIPDPVVYTGSGDSVIEIQPPEGTWMLHVTGNSEGHHFAVKGYDSNRESTELFVNTSDPYDGITFDNTQSTVTLEINAVGNWTVELVSIFTAQEISMDTPASGNSDAVLLVSATDLLWTFHVSGNPSGNHFAVKGYDENLSGTELFVNTSDPYDGVTIDPSQSTAFLIVSAASDWTVEIEAAKDQPEAHKGDTITGSGDAIIMTNKVGTTASISGNADAHHFAVKSWSYNDSDLLVNTSDPYEGTVMLKFDPTLVEINAEGDWTITFD